MKEGCDEEVRSEEFHNFRNKKSLRSKTAGTKLVDDIAPSAMPKVASGFSTKVIDDIAPSKLASGYGNKVVDDSGGFNNKVMDDIATSNMSTLTGGFTVQLMNATNGNQATTTTGSPKNKSDGSGVAQPPPRDKIFVCGVCNRCFGYKHVLQNHERTHTGEKPFECKECHKRFTRDHHLKTHMRLHTGEKPYHCTHCERQFVQVANLRRHLRVHTGERPYACELCTSKFSDSNQLKAHMLIHKGEKPFECEKCMGRFRRRHHLMHHKCPKDEQNAGKPRRGRRPRAYEAVFGTGVIPGTTVAHTMQTQSQITTTAVVPSTVIQFTPPVLRPKRKPLYTQRVLPTTTTASDVYTTDSATANMQTQALDMRKPTKSMTELALDLISASMDNQDDDNDSAESVDSACGTEAEPEPAEPVKHGKRKKSNSSVPS